MRIPLLILLAVATSACQTILRPRAIDAPQIATSVVASDYALYDLKRVGVLPVDGDDLSDEERAQLQEIVFNEFNEVVKFELVFLDGSDLAEVPALEGYAAGTYDPQAVLEVSRRFRVEGLLVATVSQRKAFPPQKLNMQADLVSTETGATIWHSAITLQADRPEVRLGVEAFYGNGAPMSDDSWSGALLSPSRFARFGVWQLARTL